MVGRGEAGDEGTSGSVVDGGQVEASTRASQSWKDCASKRSASSMT